ncbi:hypothetical protein K1719_022640 [Acacia pycnantha]|nr:hypothetical protein K1719_022640 [Acacia pycnantha]
MKDRQRPHPNLTRTADAQWSVPPFGYVKVDVDGLVINHNIAACGGITKDSNGAWMIGFKQKTGFCSIIAIELQAIKEAQRPRFGWSPVFR